MGRRRDRFVLLVCLLVSTAACSRAAGDEVAFTVRAAPLPTTTTATTLPPTTLAPTTVPPSPPPTTARVRVTQPPTTPKPTRPPRPRTVYEQDWTPFAVAGGVVTLRHPSRRVELVGFHESNHDGARQQEPLPTAADPRTLESRDRENPPRGAADVVVDPDVEIRSPVTGTVKRAGSYTLYCKYRDDFVVIEPDERPGWEVKVLHITGVQVRAGNRVVAGETVLAPRAHQLPFESQVDEASAPPSWPHVHVEVIDPSIPDRPGPGC
jgi:hypothetical protein